MFAKSAQPFPAAENIRMLAVAMESAPIRNQGQLATAVDVSAGCAYCLSYTANQPAGAAPHDCRRRPAPEGEFGLCKRVRQNHFVICSTWTKA